jgi:L-amino acid N-acyltransferase YncA
MMRRHAGGVDVHLAALQPADWPGVRAVWAEGIATGDATLEAEPPPWESFDAGRLASHRLVAREPDGAVLGWAAVSPTSSRPVYAGVVELSVYVAARARGAGVGRRLLEALVASTEAGGVWTLQAGVLPENTASLALLAREGFRVVGTRERLGRATAGPRAGQWRDVVLLERRSTVAGR